MTEPGLQADSPGAWSSGLDAQRSVPTAILRDVGTFGTGPFDSDDARDLVDQPGQHAEVLRRLFTGSGTVPVCWIGSSLLVRLSRRPLVQVIVRVILGAIVGAASLALGQSAAFLSGLAGPVTPVALGARFGRRKPRPGGKEAHTDADGRPNAKQRT